MDTGMKDNRPEIDIAIDLEFDGPALMLNSCLQLGAVAFYHHAGDVNPWITDSWVVSQREWSMHPQEGKSPNPKSLQFLYERPGLMEYIQNNAMDIRQCIGEFCQWYTDLSERYKITLILASPASVDYAWLINLVAVYRPTWCPEIFLPYDCRCLKTMMNLAHNTCGIDTWSDHSLLKQHPFYNDHYALNDAKKQAYMYLKLRVLLAQHRAIVRAAATHQQQQGSSSAQQQSSFEYMLASLFSSAAATAASASTSSLSCCIPTGVEIMEIVDEEEEQSSSEEEEDMSSESSSVQ